jgi:hypothetical protein
MADNVESNGLMGIAAEAADFEIAVTSIERVAQLGEG